MKKPLPADSEILFPKDLPAEPVDWLRLFGKEGPVELEVGCGKGRYLLERAADHPDRLFVGLEFARAYVLTIEKRARQRGLANIRLFREEAARFFHDCLGDRSLHAFHLFYPDPWPKTRHHRRRLIQDEFLADLRRVLVPGGIIQIATDHEGYFEWMARKFNQWKGTFLIEADIIDSPRKRHGLKGRTNYEVRFLEEERPLYFLNGQRTGF